jgi:anti-anti-sigma regulatory factor
MPQGSFLKVGRTETGCILRIEGRGTMRESKAAHELAVRCVPESGVTVAVDLSDCENLDSTFLGCLIDLQRRFGRGEGSRFTIASPSERCRQLFQTAQVNRVLNIAPDCPHVQGEYLPVQAATLDSTQTTQHIMECHRLLAEFEGPSQAAFRAIANQLERELAAKATQVH